MKLIDFFSFQWWLSVGIGAVLWSIVNDGLKRAILKLLGAFFRSWGDRNEATFRKFNSDAANALSNNESYARWARQENSLRQKAIYRLLWSTIFFAVAGVTQLVRGNARLYTPGDWPLLLIVSHAPQVILIISVSCAMLAVRNWNAARRCEWVLHRADSIRPFVSKSWRD